VTDATTISRRRFVGAALATPAAALLAGGCGSDGEAAATARAAQAPAALDDWAAVRAQFDMDPDLHHLAAFIFAPHSRPVRDAIARHRAAFDRDAHGYVDGNHEREAAIAQQAAEHLGTTAGRIALTDSTTMGLGTFLGGLRLRRGDELLHTAHEHFSATGAANLLAARTGARLRRIRLYPPAAPQRATVKGIVRAVERGIRPATRVLLVTWVHSASGVRLPLREIADVVARKNARRSPRRRVLLVVDAAHALGGGPIDVERSGCDALIAGCHKWLMGPRGTGLVWARPAAWRRTGATIPSWSGWGGGADGPSPGAAMTPGGYHSFEHRWALAEAFDLQRRIGQERIAARIAELGDRLRAGLSGVDGLTLHVPRERALHSGVVTFSIAGRGPHDVVGALRGDHRVAASVTPYEVELARLGTTWVNTEQEVDAAIAAVRAIVRR
jgi:selenocysteine lyase/cysteine desulfurase